MQRHHICICVDVSYAGNECIDILRIHTLMKSKEIQQEEIRDSPDFREACGDEVGVEVPLLKMIKAGHEPVRDEEHKPEDEAVEAAAATPEGFILVVRKNHRQGHDEDQRDEAEIGLRELRFESFPLQFFFQLHCKGATIRNLISNQINQSQDKEKNAVDKGRNPVELKAKLQDIEVLVMGCEWKYAEIEKHIDGHQGTGDAAKELHVSRFVLLTHREAPLFLNMT